MGLRIAFIILLLAPPVWSVTKTRTVKQSLGDYTTLEACLNANESNITAGVGTVFVASVEGAWTIGDSSAVVINGWTTSSDYYIDIKTDATARHDGKWSESDYRLTPSGGFSGIQNFESFVRIEGLQIKPSTFNGIEISEDLGSSDFRISYCIIKDAPSNGIQIGKQCTLSVWNCLVYDATSIGVSLSDDDLQAYIYNVNSIDNGTYGFRSVAGTVVLKNCLADSNTTADISVFVSIDYCATSDGSADDFGGTGNRVSQTFTFVNRGADDFHLASNDAGARDHGTDLSGDGDLAFSDDIDGDTRSGTWDIGADEFVGAAPAASPRRRKIPKVFGGIDEEHSVTLMSAMVR